jgi:hypothetical protein
MDNQENQSLFSSFYRLPPNLRMMIWEDSIFETSVEARRVALRQYKTLFCAAPLKMGGGQGARAAMVYFHPRMDVLSQSFKVIMLGQYLSLVRCPGVTSFPHWPLSFFDIVSGERRMGSLDPFHGLRHIHLNILKAKADIRSMTDPASRSPTWFIMGLLYRQLPHVLKTVTVTVKITMDPQTCPPTPASTSNLQPWVYRVVRRPTLPLPKPSKFWSGITAEKHLAMLSKQQYHHPFFIDILIEDGVVFTRPIPGDFAILRVIDPTRDAIRGDATAQETRYRSIVERWIQKTVGQVPRASVWLAELLDNSMPPFPDSPWGICGVNYGMGEATAY